MSGDWVGYTPQWTGKPTIHSCLVVVARTKGPQNERVSAVGTESTPSLDDVRTRKRGVVIARETTRAKGICST
jgi:hypothetical protein